MEFVMSERRANRLSFDFLVLGLALSIIFILFKIFFAENIAVSTFVLFGIIFFFYGLSFIYN